MMHDKATKTRAYWGPWVAGWMGFHCDIPLGKVVEVHLRANRHITSIQGMYLEYDLRAGWTAAQFNYDRVQRDEYC